MSDLNDIYSALMSARRAASSLATWQNTACGRDSVRDDSRSIERGIAAYERLQRDLRDGRKHVEAPDDYKITSCQCGAPNASPPCSWCCDPDNDPDKQNEEAEIAERAK